MQPGVNFINVLQARFLYKILAPKITKLCFGFETRKKLPKRLSYQKRALKTLMKLTIGCSKLRYYLSDVEFAKHN